MFLLPFHAVRAAPDPDAALLTFLQSPYEAAANAGAGSAPRSTAHQGFPASLALSAEASVEPTLGLRRLAPTPDRGGRLPLRHPGRDPIFIMYLVADARR